MKVATEIVIAADAITVDESLGGRVDAFARHEGVRLGSSPELVIFDFEALALQEIERLESERADMLPRHHSIECRRFGARLIQHRRRYV